MKNKKVRRSTTFAMGAVALLLLLTAVLLTQSSLLASSHREAPLISKDQFADTTDVYAFIPAGQTENIVFIASWIPFEMPEGGPNYYEFDDNAIYDINIDNNGDAVPDFTYRLQSNTTIENNSTFLYNTGPITSLDDADWNRKQRYTLTEISDGGNVTLVNDQLTAPVNIGGKSIPNYETLFNDAIYEVTEGGDDIKVFAGQTDDPFWVDLQVFDLLTLRGQDAPIGYNNENNIPIDSLSGFNVHSVAVEIPISRVTQGSETVLGVWATTSRPQMRTLNDDGLGNPAYSGMPVQVSRLGMPLVNEVVIPLALKDAFNSIPPEADLSIYTDATFGPILQGAVEDPEVGNLLCALYGVPLPESGGDCETEFAGPGSGRGDIFQIFLTGMVLENDFTINTAGGAVTLPAGTNVNQPAGVQPAEMIRINTALSGDTCAPTPSRLGVLGGDACGFPNGRRLMDDVVEIELLAVAGAAYEVLDDEDAGFTFNGDLISVLDDGLNGNDVPFQSEFPYLAMPHAGANHTHQNILSYFFPVVAKDASTSLVSLSEMVAENPVATTTVATSGVFLFGAPLLFWFSRRKDD